MFSSFNFWLHESFVNGGSVMLYKAFVSYSHAADGELAPKLQSALHKFGKPWYKIRALRIFRDKTNLSLTPNLWPSIQKALDESEYFLLLASPEAASSDWVKEEIDYWLDNKSSEKILIILTSGEIQWENNVSDFDWKLTTALPENLRKKFFYEPLFLDLRWISSEEQLSLQFSKFRESITLIAATLHGKDCDEISGEDIRQYRKNRRIAWCATILLVLLTFASIIGYVIAVKQKNIAEFRYGVNVAQNLTEKAQIEYENKEYQKSLLLSIEAIKRIANKDIPRLGTSNVENIFRKISDSIDGLPLTGHTDTILSLDFSSDGKLLASSAKDGVVLLWDTLNIDSKPTILKGHKEAVNFVLFSPGGNYLASLSKKQIRLWPINTKIRKSLLLFDYKKKVIPFWVKKSSGNKLAFSHDGELLAACCSDNKVRIWKTNYYDGKPIILEGHKDTVTSVAFGLDGKIVATSSEDKTIRLWNLMKLEEAAVIFYVHHGSVEVLAISSNGRFLASGSSDNDAWLFDLDKQKRIRCRGHRNGITDVKFSPNNLHFATACNDGTVRLWDLNNYLQNEELVSQVLEGHEGRIISLSFSHDGRYLASAGADKIVRIWSVNQPYREPTILSGHDGAVEVIKFNYGDKHIATGGDDKSIRLWNFDNTSLRGQFLSDRELSDARWPFGNSISPDFSYLAKVIKVSKDTSLHRLILFNLKNSTTDPIKVYESIDAITNVNFSPGNKYLAAYFYSNKNRQKSNLFSKHYINEGKFKSIRQVKIWKLNNISEEPLTIPINCPSLTSMSFSPDEKRLFAGCQDGSIISWEIKASEIIPTEIIKHNKNVNAIKLSPNQRFLATYSDRLRLYDLKKIQNEPIVFKKSENLGIYDIHYSHKEKFIASSLGAVVAIWEFKYPNKDPRLFVFPSGLQEFFHLALTKDTYWSGNV